MTGAAGSKKVGDSPTEVTADSERVWLAGRLVSGSPRPDDAAIRWPHLGQKTEPAEIGKPQPVHCMLGLTIQSYTAVDIAILGACLIP